MQKPLSILTLTVLILTGCQTTERANKEASEEGDRLKLSPCACVKLDYAPQMIEWKDA